MKRAHETHREAGPKKLGFYVITVSSSRFVQKSRRQPVTDESGDAAVRMIKRARHSVVGRELIDDDQRMIVDALNDGLRNDGADVVVFTGGTGLSQRDVTVDAVKPLFEKEIEGFGEIMRAVSYKKIGSPAMLTRATAGLISRKVVVCLPGSPDAVETGLRLLIGELPHMVYVARKKG